MGLPRDKGAFIAGQIDDEGRNLFGLGNAAHRLARHERLKRRLIAAHLFAQSLDPLVPARAFDGAGTDTIAPDLLTDVIHRYRFRHPDDGGLCRAIDEPIGCPDHRRTGRRHVDDRSTAPLQHSRQRRPDRAPHRPDIQIEREIPIRVRCLQHGAVMDEARAIEQDVRPGMIDARCRSGIIPNIHLENIELTNCFGSKGFEGRAVDIGCTGIMVSNHGGRQLDGSRAPFDQLAEICDAVGDKVDVICEGGIQRGTHVLKALSVGAKACSGGRLYLYALAAAGQAGVERALGNLRTEIERDMKLMGVTSLDQLSRENLRIR